MTITCTIFRADTGEYVKTITAPSLDDIELNVGAGEVSAPGSHPPGTYLDGDEVKPLPPRPGPWAVWTGAEWIDPRTPEDLAAELQALREAAVLPVEDFLDACMERNIITPPEAEGAARGDIPDAFAASIATLPGYLQTRIRIKWPKIRNIRRMDEMTLAVAGAHGINPDTLDAIFGLAPDGP